MRGLMQGRVLHGVMFEVPSACLEARELLAVADYGCVGTNDLYQFLFALDRNSEFVAHDFRPDAPVFWSLLRTVAEAARHRNKPLSVCGEIAGWPEYVGRLMGAGIRTVSVSARVVASVRRAACAAGGRAEGPPDA